MSYPNDGDGEALRRVAQDGSDMSKPMDIDFAVAARDEGSARAIARAAADRGYRTSVEQDGAGAWSCYCTRTMVATYEAVVEGQTELDGLGRLLGGHADGWGTAGNTLSVKLGSDGR